MLKRKLMLTGKQELLVRNKILSLSRQERVAIQLYFWEEYSHFQIARNLCVSVNEIPKIIQNAMTRIRGDLFEIAGIYFDTYRASNTYKNWGV